jgi:hypothetical protein
MKVNVYVMLFLALLILIGFPFAIIWSLNTLFQLSIPFTIETWLATTFLQMITFGNIANNVNRKSK